MYGVDVPRRAHLVGVMTALLGIPLAVSSVQRPPSPPPSPQILSLPHSSGRLEKNQALKGADTCQGTGKEADNSS